MMLRPLQKAGAPVLLKSQGGLSLSPIAIDMLCLSMQSISEGFVDQNEHNQPVYNGSTMFTIDAKRLNTNGMEPNAFCALLVEHLKRSVMFRLRLMREAQAQASVKCTPKQLGTLKTETEFTVENGEIHIDIDVLGAVLMPAQRVGTQES